MTKNNVYFFLLLCFIIFTGKSAMGMNEESDYRRYENKIKQDKKIDRYKPITDSYIRTEITNNSIVLNWDFLEKIPSEEVIWDHNFLKYNELVENAMNAKIVGYIVYVIEENSLQGITSPFLIMNVEERQAYYTEQSCVELENLKPGHSYKIKIEFIIEGTIDNENVFGIKEIAAEKWGIPDSMLSIDVPENYKQSKKSSVCKSHNKTITLEELNNNREKYYGKFVQLEGFIDRPIENPKDSGKSILINTMKYKSDAGITDNIYGLYISNFTEVKPNSEMSLNFVSLLVFITNKSAKNNNFNSNDIILISILNCVNKANNNKPRQLKMHKNK